MTTTVVVVPSAVAREVWCDGLQIEPLCGQEPHALSRSRAGAQLVASLEGAREGRR